MSKNKWLYNTKITGWLINNPAYRKQLPFLYRFYAYYCKLHKKIGREEILAGEPLLLSIIYLSKALGHKNYVQLRLDKQTVFLNLFDPRMLNIPNEVRNKKMKSILTSFISKGDSFVDVGANHGSFSIIASELVGENGTIAAVEPQAQLAPLVEKSLAANAKCDYKVYEMACGDREGVVDFYIPQWSSGSAGIFPSFSAKFKHQTISVPLKKFDEAVNWQNFKGRTFIKLDVEGSELAFLRGASKAIRELQPDILMEINPWSMKAADTTIDQIVREFEGLGYTEFIDIENIDEKKKLIKMEGDRPHNIILLSPKRIAVEV